jgi:hypothetical protein
MKNNTILNKKGNKLIIIHYKLNNIRKTIIKCRINQNISKTNLIVGPLFEFGQKEISLYIMLF